jgi:DNA-binding response OmpR family regulator
MKKVLIVDDDSDLLKLYSQAFLNANFSVDAILEISEAREMVTHTRYDLILLDLLFPDTDSLSTIRLIRTPGSVNFQTPILALTNLDAGDTTKKAIEYGANECLFKSAQTPKTIFDIAIKLNPSNSETG